MHLGGDTGSERSNIKKKKGPPMALRESGSPLADADPGPPYDPDGSLPWNGGGKHDDLWFWVWMTPVYCGIAGLALYLLYAMGFI